MNHLLHQAPQPGSHHIFREGDFVTVSLTLPSEWQGKAYLRTSLFKPAHKYQELIEKTEQGLSRRFQEWGDFLMQREADGTWRISIPLLTVGFFEAKAFFLPDGDTEPIWPEGDNLGIKVEPSDSVISNSIYSAFVRLFIGERAVDTIRREMEEMGSVQEKDYAVIPDSGKFRDLIEQVDFIVDELGFDIIMLLPVHPTPTTYARMGLLGSPYAALDFMNVDPALAHFDKETTPLEQFSELIDAVHAKHARIFMDIPVNHTGWASQLQVHHPEYFVKSEAGKFVSPGAWGVTWSDLAKLDYSRRGLWEYMAEVFLFWCAKGVDGFRCDAGYMIPMDAWKYITARVRREFPGTVFLLEGLGGKVSTTEKLLTECNLNWAYSEMFQNYDQGQMEWYIGQYQDITFSKGPLVNFSETHDNNRLASVSRPFSRLRNALTALLSDTGTFGITCGVEWYAEEKIDVHRLTSMNWGSRENQVAWLRRLNNIIKTHPSFVAGSTLEKVHVSQTNSIAYKRSSPGGSQTMIVMANLSDQPNELFVDNHKATELYDHQQDLLTGEDLVMSARGDAFRLELKPYQVAAVCNDPGYLPQVMDLRIDRFVKEAKAERLLKLQIMKLFISAGYAITEEWIEERTKEFEHSPYAFFFEYFPQRPPVIQWSYPRDVKREVVVPVYTPVLVQAGHYFRFRIRTPHKILEHGEGFYLEENRYVSIIPPGILNSWGEDYYLDIEVYDGRQVNRHTGHLMISSGEMFNPDHAFSPAESAKDEMPAGLSVNHRSGTSLSRGDFSQLRSKYDALIAANLHPDYPEDRHIMLSRMRGWTGYKGFSRAIISEYQKKFFHSDNLTRYYFEMPAGGGKLIPLWITYRFDDQENRLQIIIRREAPKSAFVPDDEAPVKVILRPDIESRNHHELTKAFAGPEDNWPGQIQDEADGFRFEDQGNVLDMRLSGGSFVREDEWQYMVKRPVEEERGMDGNSDLFSPGYFQILLRGGEEARISASVSREEQNPSPQAGGAETGTTNPPEDSNLHEMLKSSIRQFIVKRNNNRTVIAGYPWFLDWGRDTLICLRGIIAAGYLEEAERILLEFAAFEDQGTLPNVIRGADTSNRDTSDAPLWFIAAVKDLAGHKGPEWLREKRRERTILEVVRSIANHYIQGTPNGIRVDPESALVYSPTHFTWMDTNYPAGTPRQGYPIEIQALWYHALSFLAQTTPDPEYWEQLAQTVRESITRYFVRDNQDRLAAGQKYLSDCLHTDGFRPAGEAEPDDHVRPNQLFAITMGAVGDPELAAGILSAVEELIIPGAIRSLADRKIQFQLPLYHRGRLLNDPAYPYRGEYSGEEDHRRKPAYHNGTAWTWPFPSFSEALWMTYGKKAHKQASDFLASSINIYREGCMNHIPEVLDGNHPHLQKGCYAQAWGITEWYRVATMLDFPGMNR
ncbi:MAG: glycogen debranching enzyme N-terminal domain-containing protein [Bacteroidales bacterium]|nr:glycogen debranching enzyme N-terminal domain-containing protein [Bacteroidales bacterium]